MTYQVKRPVVLASFCLDLAQYILYFLVKVKTTSASISIALSVADEDATDY